MDSILTPSSDTSISLSEKPHWTKEVSLRFGKGVSCLKQHETSFFERCKRVVFLSGTLVNNAVLSELMSAVVPNIQ